MSRAYDDNQTLQQKIMNGVDKLTDNVASTLGPRGRNVLLQEAGKTPFITKDGVTVAAFVSCDDPFENAAAQIIKQAAIETNNEAGDGTTTATVLARAILKEAQKYVAAGTSPIELQRGIDAAVKEISNTLRSMARPVSSIADIEHIATISANNDRSIGRLIAMAVDRVGQDGTITIEESRSLETALEVTEGFRFDSGYCASAFVTDERRGIMHHEDPLILVTDHKIHAVEQILPTLELIAREARPLVLIAEDIDGQALAALIMNAIRGTLKVAAIKAPRYGEERRTILEDVALSTGATFITRESGAKLQNIKFVDFGTAKFIESDRHSTTIVGGHAGLEEIEEKIETLKNLIVETDSIEECKRIQERVVRLGSAVAVIRVGGATEVEVTEKKHRIEDALEAVRAAQEEGVVAGGGVALLKASQSIMMVTEGGHIDQGLAVVVVRNACREPIRQMALNAGESPDLIIQEVLNADEGYGWDFRQGELAHFFECGIIDPVKVSRAALQNGASCAATLITTNFGIIQTG